MCRIKINVKGTVYILALFMLWESCSPAAKISYTPPQDVEVKPMKFTWPDGSVEIHADLLAPNTYEKIAIIVGPEGPNPKYIYGDFIDSLLANDIAVLSYDERSAGESKGDFSSSGYFELAADLTLIARNLRRSFGLGVVIGAIGIEDGGWKGMIAANYDKRIEFLALLGTSGVNGLQWVEQQIKRDHKSWRFRREDPEETLEHYREIHRILATRRRPENQQAELEAYLDNAKISKKRYRQITNPMFKSMISFIPTQYAGERMPATLVMLPDSRTNEGPDIDLTEWKSLANSRDQINISQVNECFAGEEKEKVSVPAIENIITWLRELKVR